MGRVLGVDWGRVRIGLAVSDGLGLTAQSLETLDAADQTHALDAVTRHCVDQEVEAIVLGLPRRMDGSDGASADAVRAFAHRLEERARLPVHFWDERFSSVEAERLLVDAGVRRKARRGAVDRMAAVLILQGFLDRRRVEADRDTPDG
jgi:putative Holliday junction resolvase